MIPDLRDELMRIEFNLVKLFDSLPDHSPEKADLRRALGHINLAMIRPRPDR